MTHREALLVLLNGLTGMNEAAICRQAGVSRTVLRRLTTSDPMRPETIEKLDRFVWARLNAHVLLSEEDRCEH